MPFVKRNNDKLVSMPLCRVTGKPFHISDLEQAACERLGAPLPALSPEERMRRLAAANNYLNLFRGKCSATGQEILQVYPPGAPYPVYSVPYWWSDSWDPSSYGRDYQPGRPFFDQLLDLRNSVPQPALSINYATLENCDYVNGCSYSKNCYLCFLCVECQDCYFSFNIWRSRDCIDCTAVYDSELCYDGVFLFQCYDIRHSFNCRSCSQSALLKDCVGCRDCFGCAGLSQQQYCFFNEQLSEQEYRRRLPELRLDDYDRAQQWRAQFEAQFGRGPSGSCNLFAEDCTGRFLRHSKHVRASFLSADLQDCSNCLLVDKGKDCVDLYTWGAGAERIYYTSRSGTNASNVAFSFVVYNGSSNIEYSMNVIGCRDCFGCVGLRKKEYCILNKQYSEREYRKLRAEIVSAMSKPDINRDERYGEFLPPRLWFFAYNDSDAMLFFPLSKEEAQRRGFFWRDEDGISSSSAPKPAAGADPAAQVFTCSLTGKPFRITKAELEAYKRRGIPLPREHWLTRLTARQALLPLIYE